VLIRKMRPLGSKFASDARQSPKIAHTDVLLAERKQYMLQLRLALSRLYKLHHIVLSYRMLYGHLQNVAQPLNAQL